MILICSQLRVYASALDPNTAQISISSCSSISIISSLSDTSASSSSNIHTSVRSFCKRAASHKSDA